MRRIFSNERPFQRGVLVFALLTVAVSAFAMLLFIGGVHLSPDVMDDQAEEASAEIQRLYNFEIRRLHSIAEGISVENLSIVKKGNESVRISSDAFSYLESMRSNSELTIDIASVKGEVLAWAGPTVRANYLNELGDKPPGPFSIILRAGARTFLTAGAYKAEGPCFVLVSIPFHTSHSISERFLAPKGIVKEVEHRFGVRSAIIADTINLRIRGDKVMVTPLLDEHGTRVAWIAIRPILDETSAQTSSLERALLFAILIFGLVLLVVAYGLKFSGKKALRVLTIVLLIHSLILLLSGIQYHRSLEIILAGGSILLIFTTGRLLLGDSFEDVRQFRAPGASLRKWLLIGSVLCYVFYINVFSSLFDTGLVLFIELFAKSSESSAGIFRSPGLYSVAAHTLFLTSLLSLSFIIQYELIKFYRTTSRERVIGVHIIILILALLLCVGFSDVQPETIVAIVLIFSLVVFSEQRDVSLTPPRLVGSLILLYVLSVCAAIVLDQAGIPSRSASVFTPPNSRRGTDSLVAESVSQIREQLRRHPANLSIESSETRNVPFELWSQTGLASEGYGSGVYLFTVTGREIGHFITGISQRGIDAVLDSLVATAISKPVPQGSDEFTFRLEDGTGRFVVLRDSIGHPAGFVAIAAVSSPAGLLQVDAPYEYPLRQKVSSRWVVEFLGGTASAFGILFLLAFALIYIMRPVRFTEIAVSFRTRLTIIVGILSIIPPTSIWFYSARLAERQRDNRIQLSLEQGIRRTTNGLQKHTRPNGSVPLDDRICETIADETGFDFIVYSDGRAIASSKPELLKSGFVENRLPGTLFAMLGSGLLPRVYNTQLIGSTEYRFVYLPIELRNDRHLIVGIPSLFQIAEIDEDLRERGAVLIVVSLISMMLVAGAGFALSHMLANPLRKLRGAVQLLAGGGEGVRIREFRSDEFGDLMKSFNEMAEELERRKRELLRAERELAWREMAKQVAHEIKNPLTPLKLNIQHLAQAYRDKSEEFGVLMERVSHLIIEQVEAISRIAEEFSAFARMPVRSQETLNINDVLREAVDLFSAVKECTLQVALSDSKMEVIADRDEVRRAFINIIRNGMQSMGKGGTIRLTTGVQGGACIVTIADTGVGMKREVLQKLGMPNFTTRPEGSGLGIAITKRIIEDMGGTISFESTPGVGTKVTISLPLLSKTQ